MAIIKTDQLVTLDNHINNEEFKHPGASGEFTGLLHNLSFAIKIISRDVRRAGLNDVLGMTDDTNVHGEQVKRLDEHANETIIRIMQNSGRIAVMASEENEEIITVPVNRKRGKYVLVFDPLDGSSNIDVNVTIGTIFGIYKKITDTGGVEDVLQSGYEQVGAGYALYGSSTIFTYSTGKGVNMFAYDPTVGEFLLINENVQIPQKSTYYSVNEGNYNKWSSGMQSFVDYLKIIDKDSGRPYTQRYIGTGIADIHRTLLYGGIFLYPSDMNHKNGKLRLVYEANPLAFLIEQAGGRATDGKNRILELKPKNFHERTPLFLGSINDVLKLEEFLANENK
jgi:fructose-1,6-bisphosphatase I